MAINHLMTYQWLFCVIILWCISGVLNPVNGHGFMLLYRPRDVTKPCALSRYLRYDLSFGMGMSDTITLVFRTLFEVDYECTVDIVAESEQVYLLIVVRYPTLMDLNCEANGNAITVLKKNRCLRLCDFVRNHYSAYTIFPVKGRLRFRFNSNSSVNYDLNAYAYQVTATAARPMPVKGCYKRNETVCTVDGNHYCFTSGAVCDGILNCGMSDWFDERQSTCGLPVEKLGLAPAVAVAAALACAAVAAGHLLLRCLPPRAASFFIFNANEDNRLCIDPLLQPRGCLSPDADAPRRISLIPVYDSSSSENGAEDGNEMETRATLTRDPAGSAAGPSKKSESSAPRRKMTLRSVTAKIQETLRFVTGSRNPSSAVPSDPANRKTTII